MFMEGEKQMATQQISVFLENKPGTLAEFCKVLEKNNIDMRAMCVADAMDFGIVRAIVDDVYSTVTILKDEGYVCQITKVLTVEMEDKPGALGKILSLLTDANINLEYTYAFLSRKKAKAYLIVKVNERKKAEQILSGAGIHVVQQDELSDIFGN